MVGRWWATIMASWHHAQLAWRLLLRDWRAGELRLLLAALIMAVASNSAIGLFTDRLQRSLTHQSAELLGADLILSASREIPAEWLQQAQALGLRHTRTTEFPSVVIHGDNLRLSTIKAVEPGYPLRGEIRLRSSLQAEPIKSRTIPDAGEAWLAPQLLTLLQIEVGDTLEFGDIDLRVSQLIVSEPGSSSNLSAMAPRVLINQLDLPAAQVLVPGSRVTYNAQFMGSDVAVAQLRDWLTPRLQPHHRLTDLHSGQRGVATALDRARTYLGLASLIAVLLAGVAIAMAARRYTERHYDVSAVMRCLGSSQATIGQLYTTQLLMLALMGSTAGVALGFLLQWGLLGLLSGLLPSALPAAGLLPVVLGFLTGVIVLAGFALPPLLRLRQVSALRVLRRELAPMPLQGWLIYGVALATMSLLMWGYTHSFTMTFIIVGASLLLLTSFGGLAWLLLRGSRLLHRGVGVSWRYGFNNLWRHPLLSVTQLLAFGLILMAMSIVVLLRTELIANWQAQLPDDAPNHFVVNILPADVDRFKEYLQQHQIKDVTLHPVIRGRLTHINNVAAAEQNTTQDGDRGTIRRELNLTWSAQQQPGSVMTQGAWWDGDAQQAVSVEEGVAQRLQVGLGDRLRFDLGGQALEVAVTSLRRVEWDSMRPNFFMIFPPGPLDTFPTTYMTSLHIPPHQSVMMAEMVRQFPAITVVDLGAILSQLRAIVAQVSVAVEYVLLFVLIAGLMVLYAALQASLDERLFEGALLRTMGASRSQLRRGHLAEYALLGGLSGLLGAVGCELVSYLIYTQLLELPYQLHGWLWLLLPAIGALLIGAAGFIGTRRVVRQSPLVVLNGL